MNYSSYINSEAWKEKRKERLRFAGRRCELCNRSSDLDVHHRTYERLGDEKLNDLIVLCSTCHRQFHDRLSLHYEGDFPQDTNDEAPSTAFSLTDGLKEFLEEYESAHGDEHGLTGIPSGFRELDKLTGGWQQGNLILIAGRPGMGTEAFAFSCGLNAATYPDSPAATGIFSFKMTSNQLVQQLLTMESRVDVQKARAGRMKDEDQQRIAKAAGKFSEMDIAIHTSPGMSLAAFREEAYAMTRRRNIELLVIDSLDGLSTDDTSYNGYRQFERRDILRDLKSLSLELNIPILLTSGLQRSVESRGGDKRPRLSDLPKSDGAIEEISDVVAFIYRAEHYGITVDKHGNSTEGLAEIIIEKQRNGPTGTAELAFVDRWTRFENLVVNSKSRGAESGENEPTPTSPDDEEAPF